MDKICIVKRRKRITGATYGEAAEVAEGIVDHQDELVQASCTFINGATDVRIQDYAPTALRGAMDQKLSVQLDPLGSRTFSRSGPASSTAPYGPEVIQGDAEGRYVFNFLFKKVHDVRMLSPKDVCVMLKVSRRFLMKLIKSGKIDSYKLGRLRRFLLDDILTYLGENKDVPALPRPRQMMEVDQRD